MASTEQFEFDEPVHFSTDTRGLSPSILHDLIGTRAYQIFERRGRAYGGDHDDWLQAEREIRHHLGL